MLKLSQGFHSVGHKILIWGTFEKKLHFWENKIKMGGAGSSNSQTLSADGAQSIDISTDTKNIGAQYSIFDFQGSMDEMALAVLIVLLLFAITAVIYIKRRFLKRKVEHKREVDRLKDLKKVDEERPIQQTRPKQEFEMAVYNPDWSQRQLENMKSLTSSFSSRVDLLEQRVFQGEI